MKHTRTLVRDKSCQICIFFFFVFLVDIVEFSKYIPFLPPQIYLFHLNFILMNKKLYVVSVQKTRKCGQLQFKRKMILRWLRDTGIYKQPVYDSKSLFNVILVANNKNEEIKTIDLLNSEGKDRKKYLLFRQFIFFSPPGGPLIIKIITCILLLHLLLA